MIGASLRKLRDDALDASISPDASRIVFRDAEHRDIWIMGADGEQARLLVKPDEGYHFEKPTWFRNGRRIAYANWRIDKGHVSSAIESRDLEGKNPVTLVSNPRALDFTWRGDGRLLYVVGEAPPNQYDSNLWEVRFDPATGKPSSQPRQLTDWTGFNFQDPEITADGKRLVFLNTHGQSDVYVGELGAGNSDYKSPRRLTLDERLDWPAGWSADSKAVFFYSDRNGNFDIYRQSIDQSNADPVVTGSDEKWWPQESSDGKWIVFMSWPKSGDPATSGRLMRVPITGGPPEFIMDIKGHPWVAGTGDVFGTVGGFPSFRCPRQGTAPCVLAENENRKEITFTAFDPVQGKKNQIAVVPRKSGAPVPWDLSPDGSQLAIAFYDENLGDLQILPVAGGTAEKKPLKDWNRLIAVAWAADGKSLFVASFSSRGTAVLHVAPSGEVKQLFKPVWDILSLNPSPDGRNLAIGAVVTNANAWTIPNLGD